MTTYKNIVPSHDSIIRATVALYDDEVVRELLDTNYCTSDAMSVARTMEMRELLRDFGTDFRTLHDKLWACDLYSGESSDPLESDDFVESCAIATVGELAGGDIFIHGNELYVVADYGLCEVRKVGDDLELEDVFITFDASLEVIHFFDREW